MICVQYIRVECDTDVDKLVNLMLKQWNMKLPKLLISVTGSAENYFMGRKPLNAFIRGLVNLAKHTGRPTR